MITFGPIQTKQDASMEGRVETRGARNVSARRLAPALVTVLALLVIGPLSVRADSAKTEVSGRVPVIGDFPGRGEVKVEWDAGSSGNKKCAIERGNRRARGKTTPDTDTAPSFVLVCRITSSNISQVAVGETFCVEINSSASPNVFPTCRKSDDDAPPDFIHPKSFRIQNVRDPDNPAEFEITKVQTEADDDDEDDDD
jgi:hypothetical protein